MSGPLQGLRVLDFTEGWAGPFCTMELGDLGAEVIKVESRKGDLTRHAGPPYLAGESVPYLALNRSKLDISLDLSSSEGVLIARRLATSADVVVESFGPGVADRLGIGYDALRADNPVLVYASLSSFGKEGPYRDWAASELVMQAMTGVIASQDDPDHAVAWGGDPVELFAGKYLLHGILAAVIHSRRTGEGQVVDVAMLHAAMARTMMEWPSASPGANRYPSETSSPAPMWAGHDRSFATSNGRVEFNFRVNGYTPNDAAWSSFFREVGADDLVEDPRFLTEADRTTNFADLRSALEPRLASRSVSEVIDIVQRFGGMVAPWNDLASAHQEEQSIALDMVTTIEDPLIGPLRMTSPPYEFTSTPIRIRHAPPTLGRHTAEVLRSLGLDDGQIDRLVSEEIV